MGFISGSFKEVILIQNEKHFLRYFIMQKTLL